MPTTGQEAEIDTLGHLEDRIQKAVALVARLRQEKETALRDLAATRNDLGQAQEANVQLTEEVEALRAERQQVRTRIEKLLGHIDQLGAA
ncbi:MAG TPA: cell division protein ZapB [Bryobacteraceae bacterium]|nr:cell division protein ZapB [Bryobacteraceae bacterium]